MKKITLLIALLVTCCLWQMDAQNYASLSEAADAGVKIYTSTNTSRQQAVITHTGGRAVTATFTDRPTFQASCGGVLDLEDIGGGPGPGTIVGCGDPIDNTSGGTCFPAGEIIPGIQFTVDGGAGIVYAGTDWNGPGSPPFPMLGANTFVNYTILNFTNNDVMGFGFDLMTLFGASANVDIRIIGTGGLIDTFNISAPNTGSVFFGATADEVITSVEIQDNNNNAELIGNVEFGPCLAMPFTECGPAPLPIPAVGTSGPMDPSPANVTETGFIGTDWEIASVDLDLNHTFDGDLEITLTSPMGTVLFLADNLGGSGNDYIGTVFMDGNPNITTGSPPFTGTFEPQGGTLNGTFDTETVTGNWTLNILDLFGGDSGQLNNFCINFNPLFGDPPVIVCPPDVMANTDPGVCGAVVNFTDAVAIDPEDGPIPVTQTMGLPTGSVFPVGVSIVEFSATDSDGNTSTCQFTITVTDDEDPVVVCQDITVELDANGDATIFPGDVVASSSDNCPTVTLEFLVASGGGPGSLSTLFASNNGGALGGAVYFDVSIAGNDLSVTGLDVNTAEAGNFTIDVYTTPGTSVGNETNMGLWTLVGSGGGVSAGDDNPSFAALGTPFTLSNSTSYGMAVIFTSAHGHEYTNGTGGNQFFSNADLDMTLGQASNAPFTGGIFSPRVFNGTLYYDTASLVPAPFIDFTCADVGVNTVTVQATDESGNTSTCTADVTVEDNIAPVIVCEGEFATINVSEGGDNIGAPIDSNLPPTESTATVTDSGEIGTVYTIESVTLDITHTFDGDLDLELISPMGTVLLLSDQNGGSGDNYTGTIFADGGADITAASPPFTGTFEPEGGTFAATFAGEEINGPWVLRVTDNFGGDVGTLDSFNFNYSYEVTSTPLEVDLDANGMATLNASDLLISVDEACGWTATVAGVGAPVSLETTFAGGNGNFGNMFDMNALNDVTIESFDIHGDTGATFDVEVYAKLGTYVGFETDPGAWTLIGTAPGIVSNGDGVATPLDLMLGYDMASGETHGFYVTPTDFSTGGFNYTNGTGVGNVFASDANIEFREGSGSGYPFNGTLFSPRVWNGNIIYTAGGGMSTTIDFTCDDLGENLIEVTVTDDSGNVATCTATVNVNDVTPPVLVCMDVTIELDENGIHVIDPEELLAQMPSTYEVITISSDNQSGAPGETDFTVPVTAADNVSFDWDYSTMDGAAFDGFGYLLNGVYTELTDPGGANNQTGSAGPIAVAPGDIFGFRSTSTDGLFGPSTTVVSNFVPGFTGQFDPANWTVTLNNSDGDAFFVEIPGGPLSFDACGIEILAVDITEVTCDDIGTPVVITVFAADSSLNIAVCQSTVTVVDLLPPVVTCPADQTVDPGPGNLFWEVEDYFALGEASATDNCTDPLTLLSQDPAPGTLLIDGVYTITMIAEDEYGNIGTCTFELTVESVLGLDDQGLGEGIVMYPNPAQDKVTIANSTSILLDQAVIYDVNGRLINTIDLRDTQQEATIDVSQLASGVYMVQIQGEDAVTVKRLVKE